jgi:hypothetical protein
VTVWKKCGHPRTEENTRRQADRRKKSGYFETCRECRRVAVARYKRSAKGRVMRARANARYDRSGKGRERDARYSRSCKGREAHARYERSYKARERAARYRASDKGFFRRIAWNIARKEAVLSVAGSA